MREFLRLVTARAVVLHGIAGTLMPTLMVMMTTRFFGENKLVDRGALHLSLRPPGGVGLHPSLYAYRDLSRARIPLPSGGAGGYDHRHLRGQRRFLVPEDSWDFPPARSWPSDWISGLEMKGGRGDSRPIPTVAAWAPLSDARHPPGHLPLTSASIGNWLKLVRIAWRTSSPRGSLPSRHPYSFPGFL